MSGAGAMAQLESQAVVLSALFMDGILFPITGVFVPWDNSVGDSLLSVLKDAFLLFSRENKDLLLKSEKRGPNVFLFLCLSLVSF